ncbi:MAG: hypothetical protein IPG28_08730 [Betaproteobacteria bacterium]|nr:hypothetical protein [Betaproteobacteria bacterium]
MKRVQSLVLAGLAGACLATPIPSWAERGIKSQQVQFAKGSSSASVKGNVVGNEVADYRLRARRPDAQCQAEGEQHFNLLQRAAAGSTGDAIYNGSLDGTSSSTTLPADGEYTVRVYQMGHAKSSGQRSIYTLDVSITGGGQTAAGGSKPGAADPLADAPMRAGQGKFNATGKIPCAQAPGQPMVQCDFGVARAGVGSAVVSVTLPDGRKRMIMFEKGRATGADLSQADGDMSFSAKKEADLYTIRAGKERYEIPEALISGG